MNPAPTPQQAPNPAVLKMIWIALTATQFMYAGLLKLVQFPQTETAIDTNLLLGVAAVTGAISIGMYYRSLRMDALREKFAHTSPEKAFGSAFVSYIICWAMNETVAVMGFMKARISGGGLEAMLPLLFAGVVLNFIMFPRAEPLMKEAIDRKRLSS